MGKKRRIPIKINKKNYLQCCGAGAALFVRTGAGAGILTRWSKMERLNQGFGAGAVTLARLQLHLKDLFNNSGKLHGT